ncbi:MAG: acyl-CoA dehydrogenase [candidate division Zixibacteria bacterium]|nr:acyl-CoA dehydrogenase [candidate division Zixibacteria bacterium]
MDFRLSEDNELIRDAAREFAEKRLFPNAEKFDEEGDIPHEIYQELAELGYFGMMVPEKYGGMELDNLTYICAMEEFARGCAGAMISLSVHNSLVCEAILQYGTDEQKEKYLPKLASGEIMGAYCLTEPNSGTDAGSLKTTAAESGDNFVLNGTKTFVTNGGIAGIYLVFTLTSKEAGSKGISCIIVEKDTKGMSIGAKEKKMGLKGSDTREISFDDCEVPQSNLLGERDKGFKIALSLLANGRIGVGSQAVGIAQAAYEEAIKYSKEREQFGQPICNFQAIAFKLADMKVRIDASRLLVHRAAWLKDNDMPHSTEASVAKLYATQSANWVCNEAVQIHGGYGYIKEYAVERYFRDARVTEIYEGTSEAQKIVISRAILK